MLVRSWLGLGLLRVKALGGMSRTMKIILKGSLHELPSAATARKDDAAAADLAAIASPSQLRQPTYPPLGRQQHPATKRQRIARFNLRHQQG